MANDLVFEGDILLCEDNQMNQTLICNRLAKAGLKITVAENGKEGVESVIFRKQNAIKPFDLIFMDIYMPVMDGFEATAEIIKLKTGTPIIALTASNSPDEKKQYIAHGMSGSVGKPFTTQEMLACLSKYLKPPAFDPMDLDTADQSVINRGSAEDRPADNAKEQQDADLQSEKKFKNKLINIFLKSNKTIYSEITQAIGEGDIKLAHRLAHTIKSNAGMLEKTRLQKAANDVEDLLRNEENHMDQLTLNVFKVELDIVLYEFELLMAKVDLSEEEESAEISPEPIDNEKVQSLFEKLEYLLDGGDLECLNLISSLRRISGCAVPLIQELIQQIEYFELDEAMKTLVRLRTAWNGGMGQLTEQRTEMYMT